MVPQYQGTKSHLFRLLVILAMIGFAPAMAGARGIGDQKDLPEESTPPRWQLSAVAGGVSKHLSTEYEPRQGYTETHSCLGLEIAQAGPGWKLSAQAFRFDDSFNEDSFFVFAALGYRLLLPGQFFVYGGVGAGIVDTSYYSGPIALPVLELGWWRISVQGSYLPKLNNGDEVMAAQLKLKVFEW